MLFHLSLRENKLTRMLIEFFAFPQTEPKSRKKQAEQEDFHYLDQYGDRLLRLAMAYLHNRSDAEDVVQETMIQLIRKKPDFVNAEHEKAWLYRVTINLAKNRLKANGRQNFETLSESLSSAIPEDFSYLWGAVAVLSELQRSILHLFYYEGYATKEIAQLLEIKESTVRSHLHRGRKQLEKILKGEEIDEANL